MLVLTRRIGESIMAGDEIEFVVLGIDRNHIRIGVKAPKHISIHRKEIYLRVKAEERGERPPFVKTAVA